MSDMGLVGKWGTLGSSEGRLVPTTVTAPLDRTCVLFHTLLYTLFQALGTQK